MKTIILLLLSILSINTHALSIKKHELYVYFSLQSQTETRETGRTKAAGWNNEYLLYEDDIDRYRGGIGLEWKMQLSDRYKIAPGLMWQNPLHVQQRTTTYGSLIDCNAGGSPGPSDFCVPGASRDDMMHISYWSFYINNYWKTDLGINVFAAPIFIMPDVNNHGRFKKYRINNGYGYHIGLEIPITEKFIVQGLWRSADLTTRDKSIEYKGERKINTLQFNFGYAFDL